VISNLHLLPTTHSYNMSVKSIVEKSIESDFIVVFSKSYCPYCKQSESPLPLLLSL
jgi:hypothetical protein